MVVAAGLVVGGSGRIKIGDDVLELSQWDVVRVAPEAIRGFKGGPEGLEGYLITKRVSHLLAEEIYRQLH